MTRESSLLDGPSAETLTWGSIVITGVMPTSGVCGASATDVRVVGGLWRRGSLTSTAMVDSADLGAVRLCVSRRFVGSLCVEPKKGTLRAKAGEAEVVAGLAGAA